MRCLTAVVIALLAICVSSQTVLLTKTNEVVVPCGLQQYSIDVTNTAGTYLNIVVYSNNSATYLEVSNSIDYFLGTATVAYTDGPAFSPEIDFVCNFTAGTWYFSVTSENTPAEFNLTVTQITVPFTQVTIGQPTYNVPKAYNGTELVDQYDFYHFTIQQTVPNPGQTLEIQIEFTSVGSITDLYLNKGGIPYQGGQQSCALSGPGTVTWVIDYCTLLWLFAQPGSDYYLAALPSSDGPFNYTVEVTIPSPAIQTLGLNQTSPVYSFTSTEIQYYSIQITNDTAQAQVLNISITNVQNGEVTLVYELGQLPFVSCLGNNCPAGNSSNCCQDVDTACQLVVQACNIVSGTYYIGVQPTTFDSYGTYPIYYQLQITLNWIGEPGDLVQGTYYSASISQSEFHHYYLDSSGYDVEDQTLVNLHLYVDTGSQTDNSIQTYLYVNFDDFAGPDGSCWTNVASCSVTGSKGACTVQINSCLYNFYDDWYASVYVSSAGTFYGGAVGYTVISEYVDPIELDTPYLVLQSSLAPQQYDHYTLDGDLLGSGQRVALYFFDITGSLTVYKNNGNLAGSDSGYCPPCYNSTEQRTISSSSYAWVLANCDQQIDIDFSDLYFSVLASSSSTYSLTLINDDADDEDQVSNALEQNSVLVVEIDPVTTLSYSVRSDPGEQSYLRMTINVIDYSTTGPVPALTLSLSNTSYYNCIPSSTDQENYFEVRNYQCTVDSDGYCTIVIQNCVYNSSDGWIAQVTNPSSQTKVYFNLWYDIFESIPDQLSNFQTVASSVDQYVYDQYSYQTSGTDTFLIEVFFDECVDQQGNACQGSLYVSEVGPTGPADTKTTCVGPFFNGTDSSRVVYVASSCTLPSQLYYFAVGTSSPLDQSYPLRYTVTVTEQSYAVPTQLNTPMIMQIYPGQKIYHTFTTTLDSSKGQLIYIVLNNVQGNGEVYPVLAQSSAPTNNSCCYEYDQITEVEYCQVTSTASTWSVLVQAEASSSQYNFQPLGYTIFVGVFGSTPIALPLAQPTTGSVENNLYSYYSIGTAIPSSSQLVLSISNVNGGTVTPYYGFYNPPTANCADGQLAPCSSVTACPYYIQACVGSPQYISLRGTTLNNFNAITYNILLEQVVLQNITSVPVSYQLPSAFSQVFAYTTPDLSTYTSPQLTFTVSSNLTGSYSLSVSTSLCSDDTLVTQFCASTTCEVSLSQCDLASGTYYVTVQTTPSNNVTISATAADLTAGAVQLTANQNATQVNGQSGQSYPFYVTVPASASIRSLSYAITQLPVGSSVSFNFGQASPECSLVLPSSTSYSVESCCLQAGSYYLLVTPSQTRNFTVSFTLSDVGIFSPSASVNNIPVGVYVNAALPPINVTNYAGLYTQLVSDAPFANGFWQRVTPAGTGNDYCLTDWQTCDAQPNCAVNLLSCSQANPATFSQVYTVGSIYGAVQVTSATNSNATLSVGVINDIPLTEGQGYTVNANLLLPAYFTFTIPDSAYDASFELDISVTSATNTTLVQTTVYQTSRCSTQIGSCLGAGTCNVPLFATCTNYKTVFITVEVVSFAGNQTTDFLTVLAQLVPAWTPAVLQPNVVSTLAILQSYYQINVTGSNQYSYFEFSIMNAEATPTLWWSIADTPTCLQVNSMLDCYDTGAGLQTCTAYYSNCQLTDGIYYFSVFVPTGNYSVSWTGVQVQPILDMKAGVAYSGVLNQYDHVVYRFGVNNTVIQSGQSFSVSATSRCGTIQVYSSAYGIPSPACNSLNIIDVDEIPACLTSYFTEIGVEFYFTVVGESPAYPQYNRSIDYSIEVTVEGEPTVYVPIGMNQIFSFPDNFTLFSLPVAGISDFAGQLEIVYSWETTGNVSVTPGSATLNVYFDEVPYCAFEDTVQQINISPSVLTSSLVLNSCDLASVRMLYFWAQGASIGSNVQVINSASFIRNIDYYNENPQTGAVVPFASSNGLVDEEHYSITFNETGWNFQFQAWFEGEAIPDDLTLSAAQEDVPSYCTANSGLLGSVSGNEILTLDWCQVNPILPTYLTVNLPSDSLPATSAYGYQLAWSTARTKNPVVLVSGTPKCETVNPGEPVFFNAQIGTLSPTSYWELAVYAIDSDGQSSCNLNVYVNLDSGLATQNCFSDSKQCNGACGGETESNCVWSNYCYTSGNVSIGVYNNGAQPISFYTLFTVVTYVAPQVLTLGTPVVAGSATSANSTYLFTVTPTATLTASQWLNVQVTNEQGYSVDVSYQVGRIPGSDCNLGGCEGASCNVNLNPCSVINTGTTFYITVNTEGSFEILAQVVSVTTATLGLNSYAEGTLNEGAYVTYALTITAADLTGALSDVTVSLYGVNTGIITAWISNGQLGGSDCAVAMNTTTLALGGTVLIIDRCTLVAGTYYITLSGVSTSGCQTNLPYGVAAFFGTSAPASALTLGTAKTGYSKWSTVDGVVSPDYYTVNTAAPGILLAIYYDNNPADIEAPVIRAYWPGQCGETLSTLGSEQVFWWCGTDVVPASITFEVVADQPNDGSGIETQSYTILASSLTFQDLATANVTNKAFQTEYISWDFYQFTFSTDESVEIVLTVNDGPGVRLSLLSDCHTTLTTLVCTDGDCSIPLSFTTGDLINGTVYYITVEGYKPSNYDLSVLVGPDQTCVEPDPADSTLCNIEWSVWNYGSGSLGFQGQDAAALRLYYELLAAFVPPCEEVSESCNDSLIEYVCTQSYRACDGSGFSASICEDSCRDVEDNCGYTFTEVGLPWLSCAHNYYYATGDEICEDIYDIETGGGNKLLWLIVLIVVFLVLIIFIGIGAFVIYKKIQQRKAVGSYESIDDSGAYDEPPSDSE